MRDEIIKNKFMDNCIVLHDLRTTNPVVIRIDSISAILNDTNDDIRTVIFLNTNTCLTVAEPMVSVLRILQQRG